jgi:hypothetical protein
MSALVLAPLPVCWSWGSGALPMVLALAAIGLLLASAVLLASGTTAQARPDAASAFVDFCPLLCWLGHHVHTIADKQLSGARDATLLKSASLKTESFLR